jgi:uncharacterized membrane protein YqjE
MLILLFSRAMTIVEWTIDGSEEKAGMLIALLLLGLAVSIVSFIRNG